MVVVVVGLTGLDPATVVVVDEGPVPPLTIVVELESLPPPDPGSAVPVPSVVVVSSGAPSSTAPGRAGRAPESLVPFRPACFETGEEPD